MPTAHCIHRGDSYKLVEAGPDRQPVFKDVAVIATHPQFNLKNGGRAFYRSPAVTNTHKDSLKASARLIF